MKLMGCIENILSKIYDIIKWSKCLYYKKSQNFQRFFTSLNLALKSKFMERSHFGKFKVKEILLNFFWP